MSVFSHSLARLRIRTAAANAANSGWGIVRFFEQRIETMTPDRKNLVSILASRIESVRKPHPVRVAVDGRTASGKTTLADEVAAELRARGRAVIRTSVDGFHRPRAERYRRGRLSAEGYLDDARDWSAVRKLLLDPLGPEGDLLYRTASFDLDRDEPIEQTTQRADPNAILVVDGTFLQRPELADAWDLIVFVDASEAVATRRGIARDAASLGGEDRAREAHERRYQAAFALYEVRVGPMRRAHVVVSNDDVDVPCIA